MSTSIPQTERVEGAERVIHGKTIQPAFALTLVYDRDWKVASRSFGQIRLELFVTPQFQPNAEAIAGIQFRKRAPFAALWRAPGRLFRSRRPRADLGHEISHLWTHGAGPAANFLNEGWATYAESLILEKEFRPEVVKAFWKYRADDYLRQFDGKASLLEDENNRGVAYPKGCSTCWRTLWAATPFNGRLRTTPAARSHSLPAGTCWPSAPNGMRHQTSTHAHFSSHG